MAEAEVDTRTRNSIYFCHKCNEEITPKLPEHTCPRCNLGFIEIINVHNSENPSDLSDDSDDFLLFEGRRAEPVRTRRRRDRRLPNYLSNRHSGDTPSITSIQDLIMQLTSGVLESVGGSGEFSLVPGGLELPGVPMFVASNLASNPGDYAWGRSGLDTIITQLMNQLNGTGHPPLQQDKINQIPIVQITKEQCDKNVQCSVCMEDFVLNASVRMLNCEHCYHEDCIIPWLKLHGTCPVCRKVLDPESASEADFDPNFPMDDESNTEESTSRTLRNASNVQLNSSSASGNLMEEELD